MRKTRLEFVKEKQPGCHCPAVGSEYAEQRTRFFYGVFVLVVSVVVGVDVGRGAVGSFAVAVLGVPVDCVPSVFGLAVGALGSTAVFAGAVAGFLSVAAGLAVSVAADPGSLVSWSAGMERAYSAASRSVV